MKFRYLLLMLFLFNTICFSFAQENHDKKEKHKKEKKDKKHKKNKNETSESSNEINKEDMKEEIKEEKKVEVPKQKLDYFEMIYVQAGTFKMGNDTGEKKMDKPAHDVELEEFWISKFEVTQSQWKEIMGENPSSFQGCEQCPVENVSYDDIQLFITKINEKTGYTHRLPTEAEWEYAARGANLSKGFKFSGSNNINEVGWYWDAAGQKTHPVGQKKSNELGIFDMTGNVAEWCSDWYEDNYYTQSPKKNPKGLETGVLKAVRGGSWEMDSKRSIVWHRNNNIPISRNEAIGFRLVRGKE
jgi:formylglycine-generating enzyme required for sulfatase activity